MTPAFVEKKEKNRKKGGKERGGGGVITPSRRIKNDGTKHESGHLRVSSILESRQGS